MIKLNASCILDELAAVLARLDETEAGRLAEAIAAAPAVFLAGAGRSGLVARAAAMRLMHLGKRVCVAGEVVTPAIGAGDLLLVVSGSGETGSMVHLAERARAAGAGLALVTANANGILAQKAAVLVRIPVGRVGSTADDAVATTQPMGNLFEQGAFLLLEAVALEIMARTGAAEKDMFARHANLE